jgi:hypothetical protein
MRAPSELFPLVQGDLASHFEDYTDLRNDHAGTALEQAKGILLRYLETLPADALVPEATLVQDITQRWPFHNQDKLILRALKELLEQNLIHRPGGLYQINKVARVSRRWLNKSR